MSRPFRIEYEGPWNHVMNRGRGRQSIFPGEAGYEAFLETVAEACRRFRLEVHAYCLMPNHYHLLVRTPLGNLGRAMRHIDGVEKGSSLDMTVGKGVVSSGGRYVRGLLMVMGRGRRREMPPNCHVKT